MSHMHSVWSEVEIQKAEWENDVCEGLQKQQDCVCRAKTYDTNIQMIFRFIFAFSDQLKIILCMWQKNVHPGHCSCLFAMHGIEKERMVLVAASGSEYLRGSRYTNITSPCRDCAFVVYVFPNRCSYTRGRTRLDIIYFVVLCIEITEHTFRHVGAGLWDSFVVWIVQQLQKMIHLGLKKRHSCKKKRRDCILLEENNWPFKRLLLIHLTRRFYLILRLM